MEHQTRIVFGKPKLGQVHRLKAKGLVLPMVCGEKPELKQACESEKGERAQSDDD